jgi:hypothetical protein
MEKKKNKTKKTDSVRSIIDRTVSAKKQKTPFPPVNLVITDGRRLFFGLSSRFDLTFENHWDFFGLLQFRSIGVSGFCSFGLLSRLRDIFGELILTTKH